MVSEFLAPKQLMVKTPKQERACGNSSVQHFYIQHICSLDYRISISFKPLKINSVYGAFSLHKSLSPLTTKQPARPCLVLKTSVVCMAKKNPSCSSDDAK